MGNDQTGYKKTQYVVHTASFLRKAAAETGGGSLCVFCINRKNPAHKSGISEACLYLSSDRSGNFTGTQTPGTNIYMAGRTVYNCLHALHIGLPRTVGASVRVRHLNTERNTLIAKLALSHPLHLLAVAYFHAICRHNWYHNRKVLKMQVKFSKKHKLFSTVRQGGVSAPPLPRQIPPQRRGSGLPPHRAGPPPCARFAEDLRFPGQKRRRW